MSNQQQPSRIDINYEYNQSNQPCKRQHQQQLSAPRQYYQSSNRQQEFEAVPRQSYQSCNRQQEFEAVPRQSYQVCNREQEQHQQQLAAPRQYYQVCNREQEQHQQQLAAPRQSYQSCNRQQEAIASQYYQSSNKQQEFEAAPRQSYQACNREHEKQAVYSQQYANTQSSELQAQQQSNDSNFLLSNQILTSVSPVQCTETEAVSAIGYSGILLNRSEINNFQGQLSNYILNEDENPEIINKKSLKCLNMKQEVAIRYLRPPTPPVPGEIIIQEQAHIRVPPAPPLVLRQQPPRPTTPPPLVFREAPPKPPALIGRKIITVSGKIIPPPPRKVIVERLAPLPAPPPSILVERWLPYQVSQKRKVIFQRAEKVEQYLKPRNTIIQWEAPCVCVSKEIVDLGVIRANPKDYVEKYSSCLLLFNQLPDYIQDIRPPNGIELAAEQKITNVNILPTLEGDVDALSLIPDLEREGLSEYRSIVKSSAEYYSSGYSSNAGNFRPITSGLNDCECHG